MPSLAETKSSNAATELPFSVALFVGGTAGIGQVCSNSHGIASCGSRISFIFFIKATAQAFARYSKGNAHIIVCGRNEAAAKETIASFPQNPNAKYEFLECDASRMANVAAACKRLKEESRLTKLNYLFMR